MFSFEYFLGDLWCDQLGLRGEQVDDVGQGRYLLLEKALTDH